MFIFKLVGKYVIPKCIIITTIFSSDFQFPTIQSLAEDLVTVLNQLGVTYCIGLGDGAGANIILRYGLIHESRCLGVILLNPTANKGTMLEILKQKFSEWKIDDMIPKVTDEQRFAFRKYGHKVSSRINSPLIKKINPFH